MSCLILTPILTAALLAVALPVRSGTGFMVPGQKSSSAPAGIILPVTEMRELLPDSVFFQGVRLPVQLRNSNGIQFSDGRYLLAALVDTSGHNTALEGRLACLLTEVPLEVGGQKLKPGAYGIHLDELHRFVITDIAAHPVIAANSEHDSILTRPRPLQIRSDRKVQSYRLYLERNYIFMSRLPGSIR